MRFLLFLSVFYSFYVQGQDLKTAISHNEVRVGDVFVLEYRISGADQFPKAIEPGNIFPSILLSSDTLKNNSNFIDVEIIGFRDSLLIIENDSIVVRKYELIAWDSCALSLIGFDFSYQDSLIQFPPVYLNVSFYQPKEGTELMDIKEYFNDWKKKESPDEAKNNYRIIALVILTIAGILLFFYFNQRRVNKRKEAFQKSLEEITMEQINALKEIELWKSDLKGHFVRFSFILRSYLSNRYEVSFLDKTTEQSRIILDSLGIDHTLNQKILELLKHSDMVKFAESSIEEEYIFVLFTSISAVVHETSSKIEAT